MEAKINIAEILKDKPQGTKLYNLLYNIDVELDTIVTTGTKTIVWCTDKIDNNDVCHRFYSEFGTIEGYPDGLQILLPSKEMRDWSKFNWKRGDVLVSNDGKVKVIFDKFRSNTYLSFIGKYHIDSLECNNPYYQHEGEYATGNFKLEEVDAAQAYINTIEERFGGKLNRETLKIEKAQPEFKDGDILYATDLISGIIYINKKPQKNIDICYCYMPIGGSNLHICNLKNSYDCTLPSNTIIESKTRFATEEEKQQLFDALAKEGKAWDAEKKQIVDLKPVFELGGLYVFNEEDEDGELTIIGKLIGKNEIEDTLTFGNQYEIENEKFVTDQAFDLRISIHEELREATEGEAITFQEAYAILEKSKKQPAFKPFDKVLVRDSKSDKWRANLFGYIDKDEYYHCVYVNWAYCIPYTGNESLLGTTKDVEG